jgi:hypothetical protein
MPPLGGDRRYLCIAIPPEEGERHAQHVDSPKSFLKNVAVSPRPGPENWSHEGERLVACTDQSDTGADVLVPEVDWVFGSADALPVFARGDCSPAVNRLACRDEGPLAVWRPGRINAWAITSPPVL